MNNFLYCFDENYQIPAFCSIYSILENVDEKVNFYLLQDVEVDNLKVPQKILNHKNLNQVYKYKINLQTEFPNLIDVHVSEATYYRLFLEDYIKESVELLIYVDCDVICVSNPIKEIDHFKNILISEKKTIAAFPESGLSNYGFKSFGIKKNNYFNAGIMLINLQKWKESNLKNEFIKIIEKYQNRLNYWDQDVMNIYFNGKYVRFTESLNYKIEMTSNQNYEHTDKEILRNVKLIHFSGKFKPWSIKGALNKNSMYFQKNYFEVFNEKYFLLFNYKLNAMKDLFNGFANLSIFKIDNSITFLYLSIRKILFNK